MDETKSLEWQGMSTFLSSAAQSNSANIQAIFGEDEIYGRSNREAERGYDHLICTRILDQAVSALRRGN
jgi:hypothetical protein